VFRQLSEHLKFNNNDIMICKLFQILYAAPKMFNHHCQTIYFSSVLSVRKLHPHVDICFRLPVVGFHELSMSNKLSQYTSRNKWLSNPQLEYEVLNSSLFWICNKCCSWRHGVIWSHVCFEHVQWNEALQYG